MLCILPDLWEGIIPIPPETGLTEFKILLNDQIWEKGINHAGYPDSSVEYTPQF